MKLVFVTGSLVHGGAERHSITLANRLAERGHECHAVYVKNDPGQLGRLRLLAPSSVRCLHARRYFDLSALSHLRAFIQRLEPAVVFATNCYALMYAGLARAGSPLVVTLHTTWLQTLKEQAQMLAYRPLFWSADATVFVSERQRRHWRRRAVLGRRSEVIYNGIDPAYWKPDPAAGAALRRALGFEASDYVIGLSAVLRPEKNPVQLIDALARLRQQGLAAKVLIIGDGPMRSQVEARAIALGVNGHLAITGLQQEVRPFLSACDVLALTSFSESFSLAAVEALALGLPVVQPDVGGAAEMMEQGEEGFLFPVGDTAALVERLAALADPTTRARMGRAARERVERSFSERVMVERYERLLAELALTRSKRAQLRKRAEAH